MKRDWQPPYAVAMRPAAQREPGAGHEQATRRSHEAQPSREARRDAESECSPDAQPSREAWPWPDVSRWRDARRWLAATVAAGVTGPPAPRPAWLRRGRIDVVFVADLALALTCFLLTNSDLVAKNSQLHRPYGSGMLLLVAFVVCAPLVLRTRLPLTAWTASVVAMLWSSLVLPPRSLSPAVYLPAGVLVYLLCLYAVALRCKPWVVISASVVTVLGAVVIDPRTGAGALLAAIPVLTGVLVRVRRSGRAELAAQEKRHVGERALLEERQRIARELHDIVAHHMSVIAIQAEAAPYKTPAPPAELVESFREIRASALSGLGELRRLLGVLRSEDPGTTPQPGLRDLDALLESAAAGGVTVTATTSGTPRQLPEGVDLSAYRIVQEALSNAMRHAPGSAVQLTLSYRDTGLLIEVRNDKCPPAAAEPGGLAAANGGGHGIIGMRERAVMLGGHLHAGPTADGQFLVTAFLPLDVTPVEVTA